MEKSPAYVSQIEKGRNKKPDYNVLFNIFKTIGVPIDRIEDYLDSFGFMSPEHEKAMIQAALYKQNMSMEEYEEMQKHEDEFWEEHNGKINDPDYVINRTIEKIDENEQGKERSVSNDGTQLLMDILNSDLNRINSTLSQFTFSNNKEGFKFVRNLESTLSNMPKEVTLSKFLILLFENNLDMLDEKGMVKVINTLYEELNRCQKEAPWGVPPTKEILKQPINKL